MVQCEMCGAETSDPNTIKVEGAELEVCDECTEFGTEVRTTDSSSTSTKYSTGSSSTSDSGSSTTGAGGTSSSSGGGSRRDMFDEMDELVQDFDQRIRSARETADLSQEDLADELNEKASLIRKLERGDHLPSDDVKRKLERELGIKLTQGPSDDEDADWDGGSAVGEYTLGDVVERKDS